MKKLKFLKAFTIGVISILLSASVSQSYTIITSGNISMGILNEGHLGSSTVGLSFDGVGDAIKPGCLCEGWGAAGNGISGSADFGAGGVNNITLDSFSSTASTATSIVHLTTLPSLHIKHAYAPSAGAPTALFEGKVSITNSGSTPIAHVRYSRVMDWDVPPTEFHEYVTIYRGITPPASLIYSNDNGLSNPNPYAARSPVMAGTVNTNFTDLGPADHGALFDFEFNTLPAGETKSFSIFYGAEPNEALAIASLVSVGAEVYSLGQSKGGQITGEPATFIFGVNGVGGTPISSVPEPSSLMLFGSGIGGLFLLTAWRKRSQA